mmetsp:Transcript_112726/g.318588  ORF Transcript_112726/g.318588 Transcript_112726/m.318588 type:complete len:222 (-) Transcript_112726:476-1141(-)
MEHQLRPFLARSRSSTTTMKTSPRLLRLYPMPWPKAPSIQCLATITWRLPRKALWRRWWRRSLPSLRSSTWRSPRMRRCALKSRRRSSWKRMASRRQTMQRSCWTTTRRSMSRPPFPPRSILRQRPSSRPSPRPLTRISTRTWPPQPNPSRQGNTRRALSRMAPRKQSTRGPCKQSRRGHCKQSRRGPSKQSRRPPSKRLRLAAGLSFTKWTPGKAPPSTA